MCRACPGALVKGSSASLRRPGHHRVFGHVQYEPANFRDIQVLDVHSHHLKLGILTVTHRNVPFTPQNYPKLSISSEKFSHQMGPFVPQNRMGTAEFFGFRTICYEMRTSFWWSAVTSEAECLGHLISTSRLWVLRLFAELCFAVLPWDMCFPNTRIHMERELMQCSLRFIHFIFNCSSKVLGTRPAPFGQQALYKRMAKPQGLTG